MTSSGPAPTSRRDLLLGIRDPCLQSAGFRAASTSSRRSTCSSSPSSTDSHPAIGRAHRPSSGWPTSSGSRPSAIPRTRPRSSARVPRSRSVAGIPSHAGDRTDRLGEDRSHERRLSARSTTDEASSNDGPKHSAAVVAVDRWGNIAAVVHSINTVGLSRAGIMVDGISIPDSAWFQQKQILRAGPGNRLPDPTNPCIITRDGKPFLGSSSIGSSSISRPYRVSTM